MWKIDWPKGLENSPACQALEKALAQKRLGHAVLLIADEISTADAAARALAQAWLQAKLPHSDYNSVEPANKQRQIGAEAMRQLREELQKSSLSGAQVAHISQADRLNTTAANLFLKTLEEPPAGTLILLTTTEPAGVLPTLVSRTTRWRLPSEGLSNPGREKIAAWAAGLGDFLAGPEGGSLMKRMVWLQKGQQIIEAEEDELPEEEISKEVLEARAAARQKAYRKEILAALEEVLLDAYKKKPTDSQKLMQGLKKIEQVYRLTEWNLNATVGLEAAVDAVAEALGQRA